MTRSQAARRARMLLKTKMPYSKIAEDLATKGYTGKNGKPLASSSMHYLVNGTRLRRKPKTISNVRPQAQKAARTKQNDALVLSSHQSLLYVCRGVLVENDLSDTDKVRVLKALLTI